MKPPNKDTQTPKTEKPEKGTADLAGKADSKNKELVQDSIDSTSVAAKKKTATPVPQDSPKHIVKSFSISQPQFTLIVEFKIYTAGHSTQSQTKSNSNTPSIIGSIQFIPKGSVSEAIYLVQSEKSTDSTKDTEVNEKQFIIPSNGQMTEINFEAAEPNARIKGQFAVRSINFQGEDVGIFMNCTYGENYSYQFQGIAVSFDSSQLD